MEKAPSRQIPSQNLEFNVLSISDPATNSDNEKFGNVPYPENKLTQGRKIAIAVFLILGNSILVSFHTRHCAVDLIDRSFFSFGSTLGSGLEIGKRFGVYDPTTAAWIAAAYP